MYKDLETIRRDYDDGKYDPPKELLHENRKEYNRLEYALFTQMEFDVINYLMRNYGFNHYQASSIHDYVYNKEHACMSDYFLAIDDIAELCKDVIDVIDS